jgi:Protein of unknown function (DUF1488)
MPLIPTARAAIADRSQRAVRFAMKDGSKLIDILVSNPALESIEIAEVDYDSYFSIFKIYRKSFERIASTKYDRGYIEADGTVCIRAMDLPFTSAH